MKKIFKLLLPIILLGLAPQVRAQDPVTAGAAPIVEAGIGYSYTQSTVPSEGKLAAPGIIASATGDLSQRLGVKLQVGYSRSFDAFQTGRSADLMTYMAGPVFCPVRARNFDIYVQALAGGARETGVNFETDGTLVRGYVNHFAWAAGAGLQYRISPGLSLRPEVEYLRSSFFDSNITIQKQRNVRASLSLVLTFGRRG